ncbi:MAG TPA: Gfo/Idh/MocA family oxidoreductase [Pirellulales bacterium]|jgi:predicted dehydrogenase|nr:Gfo/Idh/MocA family oxidoreductase [Pirellulales bacterium]
MSRTSLNRRQFVQTTAGLAAAANLPFWFSERASADESKNDRPIMGCIGFGAGYTSEVKGLGRGAHIAKRAQDNGADIVALCDVFRAPMEKAKAEHFQKADMYEDYRKLLERKDIEAVTIGTPDHWHTAIALAALDAGKHVYCEKPLTLTIDEGKQLVAAVKRTGKTFQVGTQQRGDQYQLFGRAVATARSGQLGKIKKITVHLPDHHLAPGPFPTAPVPSGLNWDFWQGQAPAVDYVPERCHYTFRWFWEYSGGLLTDWGAHHLDIAQWTLNTEHTGPRMIDGTQSKLPNVPGGYTTPGNPLVTYQYPDDVIVQVITDQEREGVLIEGEKGRIKVDRDKVVGKPIEEQDADPALKEKTMNDVKALFRGNLTKLGDHMGNFFEGFKHNLPVISDVESQHRSVTVCHLGNISLRLGRKLTWDAEKQEFVGDNEANSMLKREQRAPYKISSSA